MYLQLTTRCNMTCAHCCFSATHQGSDMTPETYRQALKLARNLGEYLVLGGGEPTVHPQFMDWLGLAIVHNPMPEMAPLVVTNGKRRDIALHLAELARNGIVQAELSLDEYHDPVSERVVQAFEKKQTSYGKASSDFRGVRSVMRIVPVGRAVDENVATEQEGCCCESLLVDPEGRLFACGCKTLQLGTVWDPEIPEDYDCEWAHSPQAHQWAAQRELPQAA